MKYIISLILTTIIIFFVWNILKRLFFNIFYKNFPDFSPNHKRENNPKKYKNLDKNHAVNWDAETVDYEEIPEKNEKK